MQKTGTNPSSTRLILCFVIASLVGQMTIADENPVSIKPLMNVPDSIAYESTFSTDGSFNKSDWQARQGTRWTIKDGVLRGQQSTPEFQAKKKDHKGYDPRIRSLKTPRQFIAKVSFRFIGGDETRLLPIIEFGHHNVRLKFSKTGVRMLADHEGVLLAETDAVRLESERWYHLLAERNGNEFVVQFADGPTLYAQHESLAIPVAGDSDGMSIAGTRKGFVEIDNVSLWSIKSTQSPDWVKVRDGLKRMEPKRIAKKKK